jgi:hypothetical protein
MATTPTSLAQFKSNFQSSGIVSKDLLNRINRTLSNITGSNGITVTNDFGRGIRIIGSGSKASGYKRPFDLADVADTTFSVMNYGALTATVWIAGKVLTAITPTGLTWDTVNLDRWTSAAVSEAKYVYLEMDRAANTVGMIMAATLPDTTAAKYDYTEVHPLWYIPWLGTPDYKIDTASIIDLRAAIRLPAMA